MSMKLTGKTYLVTGSTDGIGQHTATRLASDGAIVLIHGRNNDRIQSTIDTILTKVPNAKLFSYCYDLSTINGAVSLAENVSQDHQQLDGLINNAGIFTDNYVLTSDGMERTFAVNVAAPFVLVSKLLPLLKKTSKSKILNVSSISQGGRLNLDNLQFENGGFSDHSSYSLSKLCMAAFSHELAQRISPEDALVMSCDPGTVNTKMLLAGWGYCGIDISSANDQYNLTVERSYDIKDHGQYFVSSRLSRCSTDVYNDNLRTGLWNELVRRTNMDIK